MRPLSRRFGVSVLAVSSLMAGLSAADWPQWRGPARTGDAAPSEPPLTSIPAEPRVLWRVRAGEGLASPVVADGRVFLFDAQEGKETLRALSTADGHELWRTTVDETFRDSQGPAGPRCTPVVDEGLVFAQSCRGELACLGVADGVRRWSVNYSRDFGAVFTGEKGNAPGATRHGNNGSPVVDGDLLYASVGSTNGAGMVCFEKGTGKVRWKSGNEIAAYAAPMVATLAGRRQIVNFMADALTAFDAADGRQLWRVPVKTAFARHVTTPVIDGDHVIVSSHEYGLFAVEITQAGGAFTAREMWKRKESAMNFSSPVAGERSLYGLGPDRNVVGVDLATGALQWRQDGWFSTSGDHAHASFLRVGGRVLTLTDGGELVLFAAGRERCEVLGRAQVCGGNWCNPAYSDGRLYLRDGLKGPGDLMCVELRK